MNALSLERINTNAPYRVVQREGRYVHLFFCNDYGVDYEISFRPDESITVGDDGKAEIKITGIAPNTTTSDVVNTLVIAEKHGSDEVSTTTITITQTKSVLVLTPNVTSIGPSGSFTVTGTHTNGTAFNLTGYTYTVKINGSNDESATIDPSSAASGTITITPSANTTNTSRTITVEFTKTDCATGSTADNPVIQAPAE